MVNKPLSRVGLSIAGFKCFGSDSQGLDSILPINLIIGRNNSGKSTLLDVLESILSPKTVDSVSENVLKATFLLTATLAKEDIERIYRDWRSTNSYGNKIPMVPMLVSKAGYSLRWNIRTYITANTGIYRDQTIERFELDQTEPFYKGSGEKVDKNLGPGMWSVIEPFATAKFRRLSPDRDIRPELDSLPLQIAPNGEGLTKTLAAFINKSSLSSELVEDTLLREVNRVFSQDGVFTGIRAQQHSNGAWELYLEERNKGRIPLSRSGSGLKTIILVMALLHIVPVIDEASSVSTYIFGFEELENNLHPALLRRLLLYLREFATSNGCHFFLTTHSNIAIDLFAQDEAAQIIHVRIGENGLGTIQVASSYLHHKAILDDLEARASDLLQSNAVVWVEGPSDRVYFNRWVELVSDGELQEGTHYVCCQYGGGLTFPPKSGPGGELVS